MEDKTTKKLFWSRIALATLMAVVILWNTKELVDFGQTLRAVVNVLASMGILVMALLGDLKNERKHEA